MSTTLLTGDHPAREVTGATGSRPKPRSLWPKEHGAYGQLAVPMLAALASGSPTLVSLLLVLAAVAAFVAHEPLLVLVGARGTRARRELGARASWVGLSLLAVALAMGGLGLQAGGKAVLVASALPLAFVVVLAPLIMRGREKSTLGELIAAGALAGASVPIGVAAGLAPEVAILAWSVWVIAFSASTAAVRWVIQRARSAGPVDHSLLAIVVSATLGAVVLTAFNRLGLASTPMLAVSWWLLARPPHPRALRRVGWALVAGSLLTAAGLVTASRLALVH